MKIGPILQRKAVAVATIILTVASLILQAHQIWAGNQFADPVVLHPEAIVLGSGAWMDIAVQIPVNDDPNQGMGIHNWKLIVHSTDDASYYEIYKTSRDFYEAPERLLWNGGGYVKDEQGVYQFGAFPTGNYEVNFQIVYTYFNIVNGLVYVNPELGETVSYTGSIRVVATEDELEPMPEPSPEPTITPTPTPEPTIVPSISPTPTPSPTPSPTPEDDVLSEKYATLHPVLFIHGLASYPDIWRDADNNSDYFALLKKWGYPDEYLATYSYTGTGVGINGYNNQGHIPDAAAGMRDAVLRLSNISKANGGDGEVDIVAHSMGGLIARQYIKDYLHDDLIRRVVTIGTPFLGSDVLTSMDALHAVLKDRGRDAAIDLVGVDYYSLAVKELTPNSFMLRFLDYNDYSTKYYAIYGENDIVLTQSLFNLRLSYTLAIGDGLVSVKSATYLSTGFDPQKYGFYARKSLELSINSISAYAYQLAIESEDILSLPYSHNELLKQLEVQARIIKSLIN